MPKPRDTRTFLCQECGDTTPRWEGRCPHCGTWNSLAETSLKVPPSRGGWVADGWATPQELSQLSSHGAPRLPLPYPEVNRVLGGGLVPGSLVLVAGDPGIGKSTLLLQVASSLAVRGSAVLYISGEESAQQVKLRVERLGLSGECLFFLPETDVSLVLEHLDQLGPSLAVVDSIQTMSTQDAPSGPGSIAQVRECTRLLMQWAKARQVPMFLAGHVTKDGAVAGPRVLEHMVDTVLYLEGDPFSSLRILRGVKNRFGSTNEVGVFEMGGQGLVEVPNPSQALLAGRRPEAVGSAVVCTLEGTRPLLVEVQGLSSPTVFPSPRRTCNGIDFNRLLLVTAVLSRRLGFPLGNQDVMVNVVGGLRINEPAADLSVALALASSLRDTPIRPSLVALGEIGLGGEVRQVPQLERRVAEAAKLGFSRVMVPALQASHLEAPGDAIIPVSDVREALRLGLVHRRRPPEKAESDPVKAGES